MIVGVGTDILRVARIEAAIAKHGARFAEKILGIEELVIWRQRSGQSAQRGLLFLASRFAAKEAFSKAIGLGMRAPMNWHAIQILSDGRGKPTLLPDAAMASWLRERDLSAHVSLSDEQEYALAFVVVEQAKFS